MTPEKGLLDFWRGHDPQVEGPPGCPCGRLLHWASSSEGAAPNCPRVLAAGRLMFLWLCVMPLDKLFDRGSGAARLNFLKSQVLRPCRCAIGSVLLSFLILCFSRVCACSHMCRHDSMRCACMYMEAPGWHWESFSIAFYLTYWQRTSQLSPETDNMASVTMPLPLGVSHLCLPNWDLRWVSTVIYLLCGF